jgi:hypothetical protein
MRLLLISETTLFTQKSVRTFLVGAGWAESVRAKRLRRGRIDEQPFIDLLPEAEEKTPPPNKTSDTEAIWDATRQELSELMNLYRSGHLPKVHLWIGMYRALRRAQQTRLTPDTPRQSMD